MFIFNAAMLAGYYIMIFVFGLSYLKAEFADGFGLVLLLVGNLCFPVYEKALKNLTVVYIFKIRGMLLRK